MKPFTIRNRIITRHVLDQVQQIIDCHWESGRTQISHTLCREWNWRQANGRLKEMACRDLLLRLQRMDLIVLPAPKRSNNNRKKKLLRSFDVTDHPIVGRIDTFAHIDFELAHTRAKRHLWDSLVDRYHYLGYKHIVGACLKYLVYLDGHLACLLGWGSAAFKVGCRDDFIGWSAEKRVQRLNGIANNTRFLILPWVRVQHLASKVLAVSVRVLAKDWEKRFQEEVLLVETFVDRSRFRGTCYRAANWLYVGQTKGSGKRGASYHHHGVIKSVFVYPLRHDFRRRLCR